MSVVAVVFKMPMEIAKGSLGRVNETNTLIAQLVALMPKKKTSLPKPLSVVKKGKGKAFKAPKQKPTQSMQKSTILFLADSDERK